jgi:hypothetical protein
MGEGLFSFLLGTGKLDTMTDAGGGAGAQGLVYSFGPTREIGSHTDKSAAFPLSG